MNRVYNKIKAAEITLGESNDWIATAAVLAYYATVTFGLHILIQSI
ncbi:hypothetical protein [Ekhidna sp.]